MSLAFKRFKLYLRVAAISIVAVAVLAVLFMNRSNEVRVWFFGLTSEAPVNVVWLMLSTALGTLTARRVFAFSRGLWRDLKEWKREVAAAALEQEQRFRAADLELRERKLKEQSSPSADASVELEDKKGADGTESPS